LHVHDKGVSFLFWWSVSWGLFYPFRSLCASLPGFPLWRDSVIIWIQCEQVRVDRTVITMAPELIKEIVGRLAQGLHPERIYLFGSRARDQAGDDSDIDLLVVVPDSDLPRHQREALSYDLLWGLTTPIDVIVLTRAEFQRASRVKTSLVATVEAEGQVLYG